MLKHVMENVYILGGILEDLGLHFGTKKAPKGDQKGDKNEEGKQERNITKKRGKGSG